MTRRRTSRSRAAPPARAAEWLVGRTALPVGSDQEGGPAAEALIVLELPSELIVATELREPGRAKPTFAQVLARAMRAPAIGPPRRPTRIRVAEAELAHELRAAKQCAGIEIVLAPTPELDAVVQGLLRSFAQERELSRAFAEGRVSEAAMHELLPAVGRLHEVAPWRLVADDYVAHLEVPELGISRAEVRVFEDVGEAGIFIDGLDGGGLGLFLDEEPAGIDLERYGGDEEPLPLRDDDVRLAASVALALAEFTTTHRARREQAYDYEGRWTLRLRAPSKRSAPAARPQLANTDGDETLFTVDPFDPNASTSSKKPRRRPEHTPEEQLHLFDWKRSYYAGWLDESIPALGNRTPRAAARTRAGRAKLVALLDDFERGEANLPAAERADFDELRRELGLVE